MVLIDPTAMRNYEQLYAGTPYPNINTKAKLIAFGTNDEALSPAELVTYLSNAESPTASPKHSLAG